MLSTTKRALTDYWRFHKALSTQQYSIVHLNPSLASRALPRDTIFLLISLAHRLPVLVFFHGWEERIQAIIRHRFRRIFCAIFDRAAGLIVLANDFQHSLKDLGIRTPVYRLSTCVSDSLFEQPLRVRGTGQPELINILYLSRLDRGKGVKEAIQSFASLPRQHGSLRLTIAGDGPEMPEAKQLAAELAPDEIIFLGYIDGAEKREAFQDADIFFFPTFYGEGMPIAVLEAMAYGLPIITRSVGGLSDFFEDDRMGYIIDSRGIDKMAFLLGRLIDNADRRNQMGQYNRRYARQHFAASVLAGKLEEIYDRIRRSS